MSDTGTTARADALERRLATILCADVAGYSRMMGDDEERTVRTFRGHRQVFEMLVAQHRGRIFNTAGDALLAEFASAVEAVRCATDIQAALRSRNDQLPPVERIEFRIGVNLGDVIIQGGDLLGDGVNVAARIQAATEPGGICISGSVHDQIQDKLSLEFKSLGEVPYKNIAKPIRTYTIAEGANVTRTTRTPRGRTVAMAAMAVLLLAAGGWWIYGALEAQRSERAQLEARLAAQQRSADEAKRTAQDARRAAEDSKREAALQAQKAAADEAVRRAREERSRAVQELAMLKGQKAATEAVKPPAAAAPPAPLRDDGVYSGEMCNRGRERQTCWPVALNGHARRDRRELAQPQEPYVHRTRHRHRGTEIVLSDSV